MLDDGGFETELPQARPRLLFSGLQGWSRKDLWGDVVAGLTLAAIAIPEQMATARLGGFSPDVGFVAFIAASLAFAVFGTSRCLSAGADSTITPIFAGALALIATSGSTQYAALAATLALMVGLILLAAGLLRFGWIADLLSEPVTAGFLAGIAIHIAISQLPEMLGLPSGGGDVFQRLAAIYAGLGQINPVSTALGVGVFLTMLVGERIGSRVPAALIALLAATGAVSVLDLPRQGVAILGALPDSLPTLALPDVGLHDLRTLMPMALLVSLVVMVQTAATMSSFADEEVNRVDVDRDFVGIGAASLAAGLAGAFPVNASPPRTAIVVESGGRSQLASLFAAAIVLVLVLFGTSLLHNVPHAALAGVLMFVALRILRWQTFVTTFRQAPVEFMLICVTAAAIVVLPIEIGVTTGIVLSLLHGLWSMTRARAIELERVPGTSIWLPPGTEPKGERTDDILVVAFQSPLSFVNAERFRRDIEAMVAARAGMLRHVIFEASSVIDIDFTAASALAHVIAYCRDAGVTFSIARLESVRAQTALARFGIASALGPGRIFHSVDDAIAGLAAEPGQGKAS